MHCAHHPTCPGCALLDLPYARQLEIKHARLAEAVGRYPHLGLPAPPPVLPAPHTEGYRHRLKLPLDARRDPPAVGLYATGPSRRVLDTPDCPVLAPGLRRGLDAVRRALRGHREVHSVDLRISDATGELQLVVAADGGSLRGGKGTARALMDAVPGLASVAVSRADPARKRVMGRTPQSLLGSPHVEEAIGSTRYRLYPGAFFQVDPRSAVGLQALVAELVGPARTVLDLYAGVGAYALALAPGRTRVLAVEEVPQAAAAARAMAPPQVEVVAARVEDLALDEPFDVAILNPARRGSDPDVLARLARLAERVIYVSCGPETLARDLDVLAAHGLGVDHWQPLDLFPQTPEVETVVHLVRRAPLRTWKVPGGHAGGPWHGHPSGAVGAATEAVALVVGDPGPRGRAATATWERLGVVATHALLRLSLTGPLPAALDALARRGHPLAGLDPRTSRFFADKAGLLRPFAHVTRARRVGAPIHGDLMQALVTLGASPQLLERLARAGR
ncbi:MAG: class I SAM-dependent RNA methyltransferase [Alphaproteobacteria bacterium]|nr:class I SAM-dependent RNA methyltransferase [Alphaproteobacteria bacterium]